MKQNILIVDDDTDILTLLKTYLTSEGYHVITAENGEEALEKYEKDFHGLVVTDLDMPVMDGMDFLEKLKEKDPDCIAIVLTGKGSMETCISSLRGGLAYDYLSKPLGKLDLLSTACRRAWEKKELELQKKSLMSSLEKSNAELLETLDQLKNTQNELVKSKRMLALTEMAGAVAHEISNPLCAVVTNVEIMLKKMEKNHPHNKVMRDVQGLLGRVTGVIENVRNIRSYQTKPYLDKSIIDLEKSSEKTK